MEPKVRCQLIVLVATSAEKAIKIYSCRFFSFPFHLNQLLRDFDINFRLSVCFCFLGEEFLYVTPIDQDTIVRVTINGKKPSISKSFFLLKFLQKTLLPHG
jgi:hypothetical protein